MACPECMLKDMKIMNLSTEVMRLENIIRKVVRDNDKIYHELSKYREHADVRILDTVCDCHSTQN